MAGRALRIGAVPPSVELTGLDWDGTAPGKRMLYWDNSSGVTVPDLYPMTVLCKAFMRDNQAMSNRPTYRYGTLFFWGNNGDGIWDTSGGADHNNAYWGIEPFPNPAPGGPWKFEIACWNKDYTERDDDSNQEGTSGGPFIDNDQWYSLALVAKYTSGAQTIHNAWVNLPSTADTDKITSQPDFNQPSDWWDEPPNRAIFFGQSPEFGGAGISWGGYPGLDETNSIIRGIMIFTSALTQTQVVALSAFDYDQQVLDYCTAQSISSLWYLNMNPTPTDVTDKSGNGHHGSWNHASNRPALWTS